MKQNLNDDVKIHPRSENTDVLCQHFNRYPPVFCGVSGNMQPAFKTKLFLYVIPYLAVFPVQQHRDS